MVSVLDCKFKILKYFITSFFHSFIHSLIQHKLIASHKDYRDQLDMVSGFEKPYWQGK